MEQKGALLIFYALFWSAMLGSVGKFKPFDTAMCFKFFTSVDSETNDASIKAFIRFLIAAFVLNILPAAWLFFLYNCVVAQNGDIWAIMSAAIGSISVFGFNRIYHGIVASKQCQKTFYTKNEPSKHMAQDKSIQKLCQGLWRKRSAAALSRNLCLLISFAP